MADFEFAFRRMIDAEGGYCLHQVKHDSGGSTFAGISRNNWPDWSGWSLLDSRDGITLQQGRYGLVLKGGTNSERLTRAVKGFYIANFWNPIGGEKIESDAVASSIFDFSVNTGVRKAVKIAQASVGAVPDGVVGKNTLAALNAADRNEFVVLYAFGKIKRYADIVKRKQSQSKFMPGWVNRTISGLEVLEAAST